MAMQEEDAMSFANVRDAKITVKMNLDCAPTCKERSGKEPATAKSQIALKSTVNVITMVRNATLIASVSNARIPKT